MCGDPHALLTGEGRFPLDKPMPGLGGACAAQSRHWFIQRKTSFPSKKSMRISAHLQQSSRFCKASGSLPSLGMRPDNINAALELSNNVEGGMRSLKGCRIRGGRSNCRSPSVAQGCDILSPFPYRRKSSKLERWFGVQGIDGQSSSRRGPPERRLRPGLAAPQRPEALRRGENKQKKQAPSGKSAPRGNQNLRGDRPVHI